MSARFNQSNCLIAMRFPDLFECEGNGSGESSESLPRLASARGCLQRAGAWEARTPAGAVGQVLSGNPGSICSVTRGSCSSPQLGTWPGLLGCTPGQGLGQVPRDPKEESMQSSPLSHLGSHSAFQRGLAAALRNSGPLSS